MHITDSKTRGLCDAKELRDGRSQVAPRISVEVQRTLRFDVSHSCPMVGYIICSSVNATDQPGHLHDKSAIDN